MKILCVDNSRWWGGAEVCLDGYIEEFHRRKWNFSICAAFPQEHLHQYRMVSSDAIVYRNPSIRWWMAERYEKPMKGLDRVSKQIQSKQLAKIVRRFQPDIVYFNLFRRRDIWDMQAVANEGCRVVIHLRNLFHQASYSRRELDCADLVLTVSQIVKQQAIATGTAARVEHLYDGVSDQPIHREIRMLKRREIGLSSNQTVYFFPAVLEPRKGQDFAIRLWSKIISRNRHATLLIAGEAPSNFRDYGLLCRKLAMPCRENIRFLGHRSDVRELMTAADVVLALSNDGEAYGLVPIESASVGRPVLATRAGATSELVLHKSTGWLIDPGDEAGFLEAVEKLEDVDRRNRLGAAALSRMRVKFLIQDSTFRFGNLLESTL